MKFGEFMASLQKSELKHVYLLAGEEHYYIDKALAHLVARLFVSKQEQQTSLQKFTESIDIDDLIGLVETAPFFTPRNVFLLQDSNLFKGNEHKNTKLERLLVYHLVENQTLFLNSIIHTRVQRF